MGCHVGKQGKGAMKKLSQLLQTSFVTHSFLSWWGVDYEPKEHLYRMLCKKGAGPSWKQHYYWGGGNRKNKTMHIIFADANYLESFRSGLKGTLDFCSSLEFFFVLRTPFKTAAGGQSSLPWRLTEWKRETGWKGVGCGKLRSPEMTLTFPTPPTLLYLTSPEGMTTNPWSIRNIYTLTWGLLRLLPIS